MGVIFAFLAAISNSTIGIFSRISFGSNIDYSSLAFYRCFCAFLFITLFLLIQKGGTSRIRRLGLKAPQIMLTSFFGIFVMYFFEIWALSIAPISLVSFLLYSSGIVTVFLGVFLLGEQFDLKKLISLVLIFSGGYLLFYGIQNETLNIRGGILAIIAGLGYSLFLVLTKKFEIPDDFAVLWWLFGFGTIYLSVPLLFKGFSLPEMKVLPMIIGLALIPTVCGYYFTTKALSLLDSGKVQLFEMSEPLFATLAAFLLFGERLSAHGIVGSLAIVAGIFVVQYGFSWRVRRYKGTEW